ncbi:unnamed protein product [Brachionus calyciflorus]|uniref:Uncharacterized protein n=1 Tax=Brachionus calyciflorus TaxID=104777 RepID=A0A814G692_9BILA|nr:unnamed protein product [Brachionus calyciflorus]
MFLADEILKLLVCEICFENYNEKEHLPISLFPCGHTFCDHCILNFNNQICPGCNQKFEKKAKNWAIINLIPRARIPEVFDKLKEILENSLGLLDKIKTMDKQTSKDYRNNLDWIRESINLRADDLVKRIKDLQKFLLDQLDEFENKWDSINIENQNNDSNTQSTLTQIKSDIDLEEVKTNEVKLEEYKKLVEVKNKILNERLNTLKQLKEDLVSYKDSNLNLEDLSSDNLFGKLTIENLDVKLDELKNKMINNPNEDDTYIEIENTLKEFDKITEAPLAQKEKIDQPMTRDIPREGNVIQFLANPIVPPRYPYPIESKKAENEFSIVREDEIKLTSADARSHKCHLVKTSKTELYGFDLKSYKHDGKHYAKGIQSDSPASRAGLKENDLIIEINDEPISGLERDQVIKKMVKHSKHVELTVISEKDMKKPEVNFKSATLDDKKLRSSSINTDVNISGSRMIIMSRSPGSKGFGFSVGKSKIGPHYVIEIDKNSPASSSGLKLGDYVLRLNESEKSDKFELEVIDPDEYQPSPPRRARAGSVDNLDVDEFSDMFNF